MLVNRLTISGKKTKKKVSGSSSKNDVIKKKKVAAEDKVSTVKSKKLGAGKKKKAAAAEAKGKLKGKKATTAKRTRAKKTIEYAPIKHRMNRTQLIEHLIAETDINGSILEMTEAQEKKIVKGILTTLEETICGSIVNRGAGEFMLPGLLKVVTKKIPARPARKGINPFNGEETMFKAKPATIRVKVRPMAKLKQAALN